MKIYTNTIDLSQPSEKKFWVAPYSDFGIGVKIVANGETVSGSIQFKDSKGKTLTAENGKYGDGFTVFKISSKEEGTETYTVIAPNGQQTKIVQETSNSTVYDVNVGGEGGSAELPEYATFKEVVVTDGAGCGRIQTDVLNVIESATFFNDVSIYSNLNVSNRLEVGAAIKIGCAELDESTTIVGDGNIQKIVKISQVDYDDLVFFNNVDPYTLYCIV